MALTQVRNSMIYEAPVAAADYGASPTATATVNTAAIQAAINYAQSSGIGTVVLGPGQFDVNGTIDLKGKYIKLIGCGTKHTVLNVSSAVALLFDADEVSDVINSPFTLSNFTINGNGDLTTAISVTYRHMFEITDLEINGAATGIKETNTWSSIHRNVRINATYDGLILNGSNHGSTYERVSITSFSNYGLQVKPGPDGNIAVAFYNCDVQFSAASSVGSVFVEGTTVTFDTCYIGEQCEGTTVTVQNGFVSFKGGILMFGWTSGDRCFSLGVGPNVTVSDTEILDQGSGSISDLVYAPATGSPAGSGKLMLTNVLMPTSIAGDNYWVGDPVQYGPSQIVFSTRYGRNYTAVFTNCTGTNTTLFDERTVTCSTVGVGTPRMSLYYALQNLTERAEGIFKKYIFMALYKSNVPVEVILSGGSGGSAPTKSLGTMPASSGSYYTFIKIDTDLLDAAYTTIEFFVSSVAPTNTFSIREIYLSDERVVGNSGPGRSTLNLYKP